MPANDLQFFWGLPPDVVLARLQATPGGLSGTEARKRLQLYGFNTLKPKDRKDSLALLIAQFKSPIIIILLFATGLSFVLRDGNLKEVPVEEIVPGDIVTLNAGDIIPGDCLIIGSRDLFVDEATLTAETRPVEKEAGALDVLYIISAEVAKRFFYKRARL